MDFQGILDGIVATLETAPPRGRVAAYIPQLASVNPNQFGMSVYCPDGQDFSIGDNRTNFSIQSIAKVLTLSLALGLDPQTLWRRVGVEPSGTSFNSLVQLESEAGIPRNPLINAGALVVSDLLISRLREPKTEFLKFVRDISGDQSIDFDHTVAASELETASRNRALAYFMKSFGNIENDVEKVLDFYVHECSLSLSCDQLARSYSFLTAGGFCPQASKVLTVKDVRRVNALMLTCGFYDEAGEFAFQVGLPGKSGVGGGIVAVCPGRFTVAAWSPRLGSKGNSVLATEALRLFAERTGASIF